jgi:HTH-type transcriptional regulator / antitoxin HigA
MIAPDRESQSLAGRPAEFQPDWAIPPGELILAELKARGITQAEFALRTSLSAKHINQLVKGITSLSPDVAIALERTLNIPADFWLKTEAAWRAQQIQTDSRADLAQYAGWFSRFPIDVLLTHRLVKRSDPIEVKIDRLLRFFGVTDTTAFEKVWLKPQANFKRSQHFDVDPYATALWIRLAEVAAEDRTAYVGAYDPRLLRAALPAIPAITRETMPEAFVAIRELLERAGVLLVFMPEIADTRICGVSRWLRTGHPLIALTNRNKRMDSFWFYLAHELGHILLHPGRATFIDQSDKSVHDDKDDQETAADDFAKELFIPRSEQPRLFQMSVQELQAFADELNVAVNIVAGQYAHLHNKWGPVSKLRPTIQLDSMLANV